MKQIIRVFDYLFITKPIRLFLVWTLFLAGYYLQARFHVHSESGNGVAPRPLAALMLVGVGLTLLMSAIFILGQVMDRNLKHRSPLALIAPGFLTPKSAFIEAVVMLIAALLIGFMTSTKMGFTFVALLLVGGYFYNFSPFRLKDNPIFGLLVNGVGALVIFGVGWLVDGAFKLVLLIKAVPYVLVIMALHIYASMPEDDESSYEKDERTTFVLRYGLPIAVFVGLALELISVTIGFAFNDELIFYPAFFSLPFFVWAAVSIQKMNMVRAVKYPVFILVMTICFKWTVVNENHYLFFAVAAVYIIAKLYYKLRFGVNYPTLAIDSRSRRE